MVLLYVLMQAVFVVLQFSQFVALHPQGAALIHAALPVHAQVKEDRAVLEDILVLLIALAVDLVTIYSL